MFRFIHFRKRKIINIITQWQCGRQINCNCFHKHSITFMLPM